MKKKTVNHVADTVFWYLLYFFPVIAYLLFLLAEPSSGTTVVSLNNFFARIGVYFWRDNIFIRALNRLFGANGVLPLFDTGYGNEVFYFVSWFANIYLFHLVIDFLLFIPRLAHKWMNYFTKGSE